MIKTITHEEVQVMQTILPQYLSYLKENPDSFLCRILGMYRVQMYHLRRTIYFIVMESSFKGASGKMDVQYDCKGSHVGRNANPGDTVRKDNDLLEDGFRLCLGSNREPVLAQLRLDAQFLRSESFLDYSLLVGAQWANSGDQPSSQPGSPPESPPESPPGSPSLAPTGALAEGAASPQLGRRVSARSMQLEDTRLWEASVKGGPGGGGGVDDQEAARAYSLQRRSNSSIGALTPTGGLPACPPPRDAPWTVPSHAGYARSSKAQQSRGSTRLFGGVHEPGRGEPSVPVAREYRIGVIDFLTRYSLAKVAERAYKSLSHEKSGLSVAPPDVYCERFIAFAEGIIVGSAPPAELPGGGYLVQVILKQQGAASGLELGDKAGGGGGGGGWGGGSGGVGGVVCVSVKAGCECALVGLRPGDRVHRVNGELVEPTEGHRRVSERLRTAGRPLYLTVERWPSQQDIAETFAPAAAAAAPEAVVAWAGGGSPTSVASRGEGISPSSPPSLPAHPGKLSSSSSGGGGGSQLQSNRSRASKLSMVPDSERWRPPTARQLRTWVPPALRAVSLDLGLGVDDADANAIIGDYWGVASLLSGGVAAAAAGAQSLTQAGAWANSEFAGEFDEPLPELVLGAAALDHRRMTPGGGSSGTLGKPLEASSCKQRQQASRSEANRSEASRSEANRSEASRSEASRPSLASVDRSVARKTPAAGGSSLASSYLSAGYSATASSLEAKRRAVREAEGRVEARLEALRARDRRELARAVSEAKERALAEARSEALPEGYAQARLRQLRGESLRDDGQAQRQARR